MNLNLKIKIGNLLPWELHLEGGCTSILTSEGNWFGLLTNKEVFWEGKNAFIIRFRFVISLDPSQAAHVCRYIIEIEFYAIN